MLQEPKFPTVEPPEVVVEGLLVDVDVLEGTKVDGLDEVGEEAALDPVLATMFPWSSTAATAAKSVCMLKTELNATHVHVLAIRHAFLSKDIVTISLSARFCGLGVCRYFCSGTCVPSSLISATSID
jgi:hypothetical protein